MNEEQRKKRNAERFSRYFNGGIETIMQRTYTNSILDHYAKKSIGKFLNTLLIYIINKLKETEHHHLNVEDLQKIIKSTLPPSLAKYAVSEGQKEVFLAQSLHFDFLPKLSKSKIEKDKKMIELMRRKDRDALTRNIIAGVSDVLGDTLPGAKFDKTGNKSMSLFLVNLSDAMVEKLKQKDPTKITLPELQQFVQDFFPKSLAEHAKSEGQRMLFEFENKVYEFTPKAPVSTMSEDIAVGQALGHDLSSIRHKKLIEGREFQSGILPIVKEIHATATLQPRSQRKICLNLSHLQDRIIKNMKEKGGVKTHDMVQETVKILLPPLMSEHAIAEGQKMVHRFETGEYDFAPTIVSQSKSDITFVPSKSKPRSSQKALQILESGVVEVARSIQPKTSLHKNGMSAICLELDNLADSIINTVKTSGVTYLQSQDIQTATRTLLPPTLAEHAIAEGEKMVSLYEMKGITFTPYKNSGKKRKKSKGF